MSYSKSNSAQNSLAQQMKVLSSLGLTVLAGVLLAGPAQTRPQEAEVKKALSRIRNWEQTTSVYIAKSPKEIVFANRASTALVPASITKLVTAAAVLKNFEPGTRLRTELLLDRKPLGSTYKGSLYLKGGGDPGFVSETAWFLVNEFHRTGIREIQGDLIVDDSLFDAIRFDESRLDRRVDRAYDAPVGAMSFNWNTINVFVRPGAKEGDPARVMIDPENSFVSVRGEIQTKSRGKPLQVERKTENQREVIVVSGTISPSARERRVFKNVTRPELWSGENLRSFLLQRGIRVTGGVLAGRVPSSAEVVAFAESKPIEHMVADMNKFSNNFVAEMLTKLLATQKGQQGTLERGMAEVRAYLKNQGIPSDQYDLNNPSGLTRDNKLSSQAVWRILWDMRSNIRYEPEFLGALPIAGVDGTLKNRMQGSAHRRVRAKTGFVSGAVGLAGYYGTSDGEIVPFSFIYNGPQNPDEVRAAFDRILEVLTN